VRIADIRRGRRIGLRCITGETHCLLNRITVVLLAAAIRYICQVVPTIWYVMAPYGGVPVRDVIGGALMQNSRDIQICMTAMCWLIM
jgi:hypothetical protein